MLNRYSVVDTLRSFADGHGYLPARAQRRWWLS